MIDGRLFGVGGGTFFREQIALPGQLGIEYRVLDVLVPEPCLQRPGVVAGVG
jgi:hypothetical protein